VARTNFVLVPACGECAGLCDIAVKSNSVMLLLIPAESKSQCLVFTQRENGNESSSETVLILIPKPGQKSSS